MATAKLRRSELAHLPSVCIRCGCEANEVRVQEFTWTPQWAQFTIFLGWVPFIILVMFTRQYATVPLPVCGEHRRERGTPAQRAVWVGLTAAFLAVGVAMYLMSIGEQKLAEAPLVGGLGGILLMGFVAVFVSNPRIRATHMSTSTVSLGGVSDAFAEAVEHGTKQAVPSGGMVLQSAKYYRG